MHAHNELAALGRISMFSLNKTADGTLHDLTQTSQIWCLLQLLAGKLYEIWERVGPTISKVSELDFAKEQQASVAWLIEYFGVNPRKKTALKLLRDKTAFHYAGLDFGQAQKNLAEDEKAVYLAQDSHNTFYAVGSALVFRTIFSMAASTSLNDEVSLFDSRVQLGAQKILNEIREVNHHTMNLLYGIIKGKLDKALGGKLTEPADEEIMVEDAPSRDGVGLPAFIKAERTK